MVRLSPLTRQPAVLGAAALLFVLCLAPAQAQSPTGAIEGVVVDQSGAVLPDVTLALLHFETGVQRATVSDEQGRFRALLLPVGRYDVTATLAGFEPTRYENLPLTVGQTMSLRLELKVAGVAQAVTVAATMPLLEAGRSHVSATVGEAAVQNLPVNGRNFIEFVLLTPGVTRDGRTGDLSFAGQRGTFNSLVVDGADNNNTFAGSSLGRIGSGRAPYQFSLDAVREFQVNSNAYAAEYGRAGGGVINVVTKSGTNELHGSLFEFYRDKALNAIDAISARNNLPKAPYHYHQFGGTLGGPLRRDRDFFFVNYDGQRNTQPNTVVLDLPSIDPGDIRQQEAAEHLRQLAFSWSRRLDQDVYLIRTDHQLNPRHRVTVRYNHHDFNGVGYETGGPRNAFEHSGDTLVRTRTLNGSWSAVWRNGLYNELRVQYARDRLAGTANSDRPEAVILQDGRPLLLIGRNNFSPRDNVLDRFQAAASLTWLRPSHTVKAGLDLQFDWNDNFFPGYFSGQYVFTSLASYASGRPSGQGEFYQQNFPGPGTSGPYTSPHVRDYSLFVQDQWKVWSDLTVNVGLRYDLMTIAAPTVRNPDTDLAAADIDTSRFRADSNNWGPRLGLAWRPRGQRHVLRGGWGLFYARTPAIALTAASSNNGINIVSLQFRGPDTPTYPDRFAGLENLPEGGAAIQPNIFYIDRNFSSPRFMHASLALERELSPRTTLTLTYLFVDGVGLPRATDRNLGSLSQRTFRVATSGEDIDYHFFGPDRPFRNFRRVVAYESSATSRYNGLGLELNRRLDSGLQLRVAYTLGKVVDTVPESLAVLPGGGEDARYASNPADFGADRTAGNNDQRHRLVASGVYSTDRLGRELSGLARALVQGWSFSGIVTAQSGQPYSARVGTADLNNDGNPRNDLAPGTSRNQFRLPSLVSVDPRIARDIRLPGRVRAQLIWEAFNLLNRDNINSVDVTYYNVNVAARTLSPNPRFGEPVTSAGERIMQLALRLTF